LCVYGKNFDKILIDITDSISENNNIINLRLNSIDLYRFDGNEGFKYFFEKLKNNTSIKTLDLSDNNISNSYQCISEFLSTKNIKLLKLDRFNYSKLGNHINDNGMLDLSFAMIINNTISKLYLSCKINYLKIR
jgi:hypothetical protein